MIVKKEVAVPGGRGVRRQSRGPWVAGYVGGADGELEREMD